MIVYLRFQTSQQRRSQGTDAARGSRVCGLGFSEPMLATCIRRAVVRSAQPVVVCYRRQTRSMIGHLGDLCVSCVPGPVVRVVAVRSVAVSNAHTRPHTCPGFVCLLPAAHACAAGGTRMLALLTCCEGMRGDHTRGYTLQRCRSGIAGVGVGVGRAVSKLPRS